MFKCDVEVCPVNQRKMDTIRGSAMNRKNSTTTTNLVFETLGLPRWLSGKESTFQAGDMGSIPGLGRTPREWQPTPVFLPGKSHEQRSLMGYSPRS